MEPDSKTTVREGAKHGWLFSCGSIGNSDKLRPQAVEYQWIYKDQVTRAYAEADSPVVKRCVHGILASERDGAAA